MHIGRLEYQEIRDNLGSNKKNDVSGIVGYIWNKTKLTNIFGIIGYIWNKTKLTNISGIVGYIWNKTKLTNKHYLIGEDLRLITRFNLFWGYNLLKP